MGKIRRAIRFGMRVASAAKRRTARYARPLARKAAKKARSLAKAGIAISKKQKDMIIAVAKQKVIAEIKRMKILTKPEVLRLKKELSALKGQMIKHGKNAAVIAAKQILKVAGKARTVKGRAKRAVRKIRRKVRRISRRR